MSIPVSPSSMSFCWLVYAAPAAPPYSGIRSTAHFATWIRHISPLLEARGNIRGPSLVYFGLNVTGARPWTDSPGKHQDRGMPCRTESLGYSRLCPCLWARLALGHHPQTMKWLGTCNYSVSTIKLKFFILDKRAITRGGARKVRGEAEGTRIEHTYCAMRVRSSEDTINQFLLGREFRVFCTLKAISIPPVLWWRVARHRGRLCYLYGAENTTR